MSYYTTRYHTPIANRLASGLFFRVPEAEKHVQPSPVRSLEIALHELGHENFVVPEYRSTKEGNELYLPLLEVAVEVEAVGTIAWTTLTQSFINRATSVVPEATYCFPLYDKSVVTLFTCFIGSEKVLKGVVKPKAEAKAEFKAAVAQQRVAALLEEHTPEVFETSIGNIPAQTTVKIEICYITELKADLGGDGVLLTIPTSVAPRYGPPPSSLASSIVSNSLAVPPENGLQIRIKVSSPVAINRIESRTHPVTIEMGSHGHTTTRDIRDLAKTRDSVEYDPKRARATLADRSACLGKDFVLLIQSRGGTLLASRALLERHPKLPSHSALMVSINIRDMYTPDIVSLKSPSEIIFLADRSGSMADKIEALKTAMGFFLKSLPNNCSFNICCFGSSHSLMWPESRSYNQTNLDEAVSYIAAFRSDMGGTELLSALRSVVKKTNPALNSQIIILTDGEVWKAADVFEFIRESRSGLKPDSTRFFALGIGDAVSHHLVEGIGRNGGGLAEVVSVDSAGEWKGRVIRMLEAALTPSTWKVDIRLNDLPKEGQNGLCLQAPYHIPDFHAFSRSSVYFLLSLEVKTESVKIIATAASGETITANLPIQRLDNIRNCAHLMAAKSVLNDLESGRSWLHANIREREAGNEVEIEQRARAEGEKIGAEWSLSSKWTSFVVVDTSNSLEKASRWYQAERSELADLTRPRHGVELSGASGSERATAGAFSRQSSSPEMAIRDRLPPMGSGRAFSRQSSSPEMAIRDRLPPMGSGTRNYRHVDRYQDAFRMDRHMSYDPPITATRDVIGAQLVKKVSEASEESERSNEEESADDVGPRQACESRRTLDAEKANREHREAIKEAQWNRREELLRREELERSREQQREQRIFQATIPAPSSSRFGLRKSAELSSSMSLPTYCSTSNARPLSTTEAVHSNGSSQRTPPEAKDKSIPTEVSLENLVDAQTAEGSFKLSDDLSLALKSKFTNWVWDLIVSELGEDMLYDNLSAVLNTARAIVFIKTMYPDIQEQWGLVVQKARSFINTVIPDRDGPNLEKLVFLLQRQFSGDRNKIEEALSRSRIRPIREHPPLIRFIARINVAREINLLPKLLKCVIPWCKDASARYRVHNLITKLSEQVEISSPYRLLGLGQMEEWGKWGEGSDQDLEKMVDDPELWADGWDEVVGLSQAIRLVMKEKGYPGF